MTNKEYAAINDIIIALTDMLADLRELIGAHKKPLEPNTGCVRCDIEQRAYNDATRMCPKHTQEAKGN